MKRGYASGASTGEDGAAASGNTSAAAVRVKSNPSDCPSRSATNEGGFNSLNYLSRSILAHHLGLPLTALFNRQILPPTLKYPVAAYSDTIFDETEGDKILSASYGEYETRQTTETPWTEAQLTMKLCEKINKDFGHHFNAEHQASVKCVLVDTNQELNGNTDIMLSTKVKQGVQSTPVAVLEFGLSTDNWMQKFHQGVKYLKIMRKESNQEKHFTKPLLLAIITLDKSSTGDFKFRIIVFLCYRRQKNAAAAADDEDNNFRLSLVWKHQDTNKEDASKSFGSFLRNSNQFQKWRDREVPIDDFEYLSSNCCKVGKWVSGRPAPCFLVNDVCVSVFFSMFVVLFVCLIV